MPEERRWLLLSFIDSITARELWDQRQMMASVRAEPDMQRDYLTGLANRAFWNDEESRAIALEGVSRLR